MMKIQSVTQHAGSEKNVFASHRPSALRQRENFVLALAVALAFVFVGTCIFTLG